MLRCRVYMADPGLASLLGGSQRILRELGSQHLPNHSVSWVGSGAHRILIVPQSPFFLMSSGPAPQFQEATATTLERVIWGPVSQWNEARWFVHPPPDPSWGMLASATVLQEASTTLSHTDARPPQRPSWGPWSVSVEWPSEACGMLRGHAFFWQAHSEAASSQHVPVVISSFDSTRSLSLHGKVSEKVLTFLLVRIINFLNELLNQMTLKKKSSPSLPFLQFSFKCCVPCTLFSFAFSLFFQIKVIALSYDKYFCVFKNLGSKQCCLLPFLELERTV